MKNRASIVRRWQVRQRPTVCGAVREAVMTSREQVALTPKCVAQGVQSVKLRQTTLLSECWGQILPWMAGREDLTICSHGPSMLQSPHPCLGWAELRLQNLSGGDPVALGGSNLLAKT